MPGLFVRPTDREPVEADRCQRPRFRTFGQVGGDGLRSGRQRVRSLAAAPLDEAAQGGPVVAERGRGVAGFRGGRDPADAGLA